MTPIIEKSKNNIKVREIIYRKANREEIKAHKAIYRAAHKEESKAYKSAYYVMHPEIGRAYHLRRKYCITLQEYDTIYCIQEGKCAICNKHFDRLCIDHDHLSGKIRGLLCKKCNAALGMVYDDIEVLQNAIAYLKKQKVQ